MLLHILFLKVIPSHFNMKEIHAYKNYLDYYMENYNYLEIGNLNFLVVAILNVSCFLLKLIDLFFFSSFNPAGLSLTFLSPQWNAWFSFASTPHYYK